MRHSLITLAIAAVVAGFALGAGPAKAAPLPKINAASGQNATVQTVGYYSRRGNYRSYRYARPYGPGYYAPRRYYGYGYGYRPYCRNYGYWGRPYYGRRYWR